MYCNFTTIITMTAQLPNSVCTFQELNYTLVVEDENKHLVTMFGPISKLGSGVLKEVITSKLIQGNRMYSLKVQAELYSQVAMSNKHYFSKSQC